MVGEYIHGVAIQVGEEMQDGPDYGKVSNSVMPFSYAVIPFRWRECSADIGHGV